MGPYLIYNFSGEVDDLSHLLPNERLAQLAAVLLAGGDQVEVWDRGNAQVLRDLAPAGWKRGVAAWAGERIFRKLARNKSVNAVEKIVYGLPLKTVSGSMSREIDAASLRFMEQEAQRIARSGFCTVLLNLWQGGFDESMALAARLKELADVDIFAIGQRVDWFRHHILEHYPQIDGIVLGMGYETVRRLAAGEPFSRTPNVAYRDESGTIVEAEREVVEVVDLPAPVYAPEVYKGIEDLIPLYHISFSNQACPNRCAFCPRPASYGHVVRRKSVEAVVDEVEALCEQGVRYFRISDSTPPSRMLTDFARLVIERGIAARGARFTAFARVDQNRREGFPLLREANFDALFFGLESLDDEQLRRIRKGFDYETVRGSLMAAHEAGLFVIGSLIFPLPHETEESARRTFARLRELAPHLDSVLVQPAGVYPSSDWGLEPDTFGIHLEPGYVEKLMDYPVKFIVPMRFWPPFPFSYPLMGKPAQEVTFDDIRTVYEDFSRRVWQELGICNVQDYTLSIARMLDADPYAFTDQLKKLLVTRNTDELARVVRDSRVHLSKGVAAEPEPAPTDDTHADEESHDLAGVR